MTRIIHDLQDMTHLSWAKVRHSSGTAGSFLKAYDDVGGKRIYYKLSDYDAVLGIVGHECVNELITCRLLRLLGIPHLEYTLIHALVSIDDQETETWLCASEDFKESAKPRSHWRTITKHIGRHLRHLSPSVSVWDGLAMPTKCYSRIS